MAIENIWVQVWRMDFSSLGGAQFSTRGATLDIS